MSREFPVTTNICKSLNGRWTTTYHWTKMVKRNIRLQFRSGSVDVRVQQFTNVPTIIWICCQVIRKAFTCSYAFERAMIFVVNEKRCDYWCRKMFLKNSHKVSIHQFSVCRSEQTARLRGPTILSDGRNQNKCENENKTEERHSREDEWLVWKAQKSTKISLAALKQLVLSIYQTVFF